MRRFRSIIGRHTLLCRLNRRWLRTVLAVLGFTICYLILTADALHHYNSSYQLLLEPPPRSDRKSVRPKIIYDHSHYLSSEQDDFYVGNCLVTRKFEASGMADAVAITWSKHDPQLSSFPPRRFSWQRWVWIMDENPFHHSGEDLTTVDFVFNWTMTYRHESDVYVPYGFYERREIPEPIPSVIGSQAKLISVTVSSNYSHSVHNGHHGLVMVLKQFMPVTIFTKDRKPCAAYRDKNQRYIKPCPLLKEYLFYLALENGNCKDYITEKVFVNAFSAGSVPVVLGAAKTEYEKLLPPNSFIYVRDFPSVQKLAKHLLFLSKNKSEYMKYHKWREHYKTSHRIQYVTAAIWKPLCEALYEDDGSHCVRHISSWWGVNDCEQHRYSYEHEYLQL